MLKDEDRIFKNLYNDFGWEIDNAIKRGDWSKTKEIILRGKDSIINEVKASELQWEGWSRLSNRD
jgi:NADH:ubiquinone oxidoreductase, NADH-binding (51 kD) subunit